MPFSALFTDLYQLTMASAYFASGKADAYASFELFFRKAPFKGEYAVVGGYDLIRNVLENFKFKSEEVEYLRGLTQFRDTDPKFFEALLNLDLSDVEVCGLREGDLVFPRVPILQVRGPILKVQILESALLNAINFSTLVTTYARRIRLIAKDKKLLEFGMRRAQGPNGALTASRSSYLGGFDATTNVLASQIFKIPVVGTMAHSFVQSFWGVRDEDLQWGKTSIAKLLSEFKKPGDTNEGEMGAFLAYAKVFPSQTSLLIDTYDVLKSGLPNAICVFNILKKLGHQPAGVRLDSGDLVYLSKEVRKRLDAAGFEKVPILASNELDERIIESIQDQGAVIDSYGVGTQLVVSGEQPALGGVYKLVELDGRPRMKISEQTEKLVLPCAKSAYRFYGKDGKMLLDYLCTRNEPAPKPGKEILALHPSDPFKRAIVIPTQVRPLLTTLFEKGKWQDDSTLDDRRKFSIDQMKTLRPDISRRHNPTPYKVSVSTHLKTLIDELYLKERPPIHLE